jgi:diguanylate cyclase (GGDEF)-like protein
MGHSLRAFFLRQPVWLASLTIVLVSELLAVGADLAISLVTHPDRRTWIIGLVLSTVIPLLVATPVSWLVIRLLHEADEARRVAQDLAWHDELTSLLNRRRFLGLAQRELDLALRSASPLAVALMDLDHFKHVNDVHGHAVGDDVLKAVAQALKSTVRSTDLVARWGGEEFVLLLPATDEAEAQRGVERVRQAVAELRIELPVGGRLQCTASLGVAGINTASRDLDDLLRRADDAMYEAKRGGRNRVVQAPPA